MITIEGLNGIKATVLAHSISQAGKEMITWEIEYPRLILAELNTHRQLSRNSYSSRAVPFLKMLEQLNGEPVRFGANQAGMQDKGEDFNAQVDIGSCMGLSHKFHVSPKEAWQHAKKTAIAISRVFFDAGYHKQVYNRLLEAFQMQKTVLSATETDNFFWLRDDDAADPTIRELARVMREAMEASRPNELASGEWHLPYIWSAIRDNDSRKIIGYIMNEGDLNIVGTPILTLEEAIKVSCARCAAVSYRNEGYDLAKSIEVYDRLVGSDKKHASAFEHCATPMMYADSFDALEMNPLTWEEGITHMDRQTKLWSGNLQGFIQYRKLIKGECYTPE